MYILVMCPFVLSTGNAILSFENTCSSIKDFFLEKKLPRLPKANSCARLISEYVASSNEVDMYLLKDSIIFSSFTCTQIKSNGWKVGDIEYVLGGEPSLCCNSLARK